MKEPKESKKSESYEVNTFVPIFSGFYDTIFSITAREEKLLINDLNERREEEGKTEITDYDLFEFNYKEFESDFAEQIESTVADELKSLNLITSSKYEKVESPAHYNFRNDNIDVTYTLTTENIENITKYLNEWNENFAEYIEKNYTSYDGFMSWHSNDFKDWMNEEVLFDNHKLGAIFNFILKNENFNQWNIRESLEVHLSITNYDEMWELEFFDKCQDCKFSYRNCDGKATCEMSNQLNVIECSCYEIEKEIEIIPANQILINY